MRTGDLCRPTGSSLEISLMKDRDRLEGDVAEAESLCGARGLGGDRVTRLPSRLWVSLFLQILRDPSSSMLPVQTCSPSEGGVFSQP